MNVSVETYKPEDDEPESVKRIDYNESKARRWLAKHCWWAFNNDREVILRRNGVES